MTKYPSPIVTIDVVLLTLIDGRLCTALSLRERDPHAGEWTLPGGWIRTDEDEDAAGAAARILAAKAGLESPYLEQLCAFASRHRDPRGWSVSIAYYALVPPEQLTHRPKPLPGAIARPAERVAHGSAGIQLRPVDAIRSLPFDHLAILRTAVERVRSKTAYSSLPVHLMPETFTLSELQRVYETVLGGPLDKRSFRRRIEELDVVEPAPGALATGAHRPAQRFRRKRRRDRVATVDRTIDVKE